MAWEQIQKEAEGGRRRPRAKYRPRPPRDLRDKPHWNNFGVVEVAVDLPTKRRESLTNRWTHPRPALSRLEFHEGARECDKLRHRQLTSRTSCPPTESSFPRSSRRPNCWRTRVRLCCA